MTTFARQYAESLAQVSGHAALIADRDQFIAAAGGYLVVRKLAIFRRRGRGIGDFSIVDVTALFGFCFCLPIVPSLAQVSGHAALIADRDQFIAAAGGYKQMLNKSVSRQMDEKIHNRETIMASRGDRSFIPVCDEGGDEYQHEAIAPILCEGDIIGSVVLLQNDNKNRMGEVEQKLLLSAAGFLGRQMEQ